MKMVTKPARPATDSFADVRLLDGEGSAAANVHRLLDPRTKQRLRRAGADLTSRDRALSARPRRIS